MNFKSDNFFIASLWISTLLSLPFTVMADEVQRPQTTIDVVEHGVISDGSQDVTEQIQKLLQDAIATKEGTTIYFPPGKYALNPAATRSHALQCKDGKNIVLKGTEGTKFIIKNPKIGFLDIEDSKSILIENLIVDYDPLPFTQLKVIGRKADGADSAIIVQVMDGFPDLKMPHLWHEADSVIGYKADGQFNPHASLLGVKDIVKISDLTYELKVKAMQGSPESVQKGDILCYGPRLMGKGLIKASRVEGLTIDQLNACASPEVFLLSVDCEGLQVKNSRIAPPAGSTRLLSTTADGVFVVGGRKGPIIESNVFSGNGDDSINIHATGGFFYGFPSPTEVVVTENPWTTEPGYRSFWEAGDTLEISETKSMDILFRAKILSVSDVSQGGRPAVRISFDPHTDSFFSRPDVIANHPVTTKAYEDISSFNIDYCGAGFQIAKNRFSNHRGRGVLLQSRDGVIEDNLFERTDAGIWLVAEGYYKDGPSARNVKIQQNRFIDLGKEICNAVISVSVSTDQPGITESSSQQFLFSNISITDNHITSCLSRGVYVNNAENVTVTGNSIRSSRSDKEEILAGPHVRELREENNTITQEPSVSKP